MTLKEEKGKIQQPTIQSGSAVELWFADDPLEKHDATNKRKRWEAFLDEFDPRASTKEVWSTYEELRVLLLKPILSHDEQALVGPKSFAHFMAFTQSYTASDVHLYSHLFFHHAPAIVRTFKSVGVYKNEVIEAMNAQIKRYLDRHSAKGGWGTEMTNDVIVQSRRRLGDIHRDITAIVDTAIDNRQFERGSWLELRSRHVDGPAEVSGD